MFLCVDVENKEITIAHVIYATWDDGELLK